MKIFQSLTWTQYLVLLAILTILYYGYVYLRFYRKDPAAQFGPPRLTPLSPEALSTIQAPVTVPDPVTSQVPVTSHGPITLQAPVSAKALIAVQAPAQLNKPLPSNEDHKQTRSPNNRIPAQLGSVVAHDIINLCRQGAMCNSPQDQLQAGLQILLAKEPHRLLKQDQEWFKPFLSHFIQTNLEKYCSVSLDNAALDALWEGSPVG